MAFSEIGEAAALLRGILGRGGRAPAPAAAPLPATRSGRIEQVLEALCRSPGLRGAVLADASGLPVASHGGPFSADRWAAFSTLLGAALDGAGRLLGAEAATVSLRLSGDETALLTRFSADGLTFQLAVLCAARAAPRADLAGAVEALRRALTEPAA